MRVIRCAAVVAIVDNRIGGVRVGFTHEVRIAVDRNRNPVTEVGKLEEPVVIGSPDLGLEVECDNCAVIEGIRNRFVVRIRIEDGFFFIINHLHRTIEKDAGSTMRGVAVFSKGDAKVEVLVWYARICMFGAYLHTKNAPCGAL